MDSERQTRDWQVSVADFAGMMQQFLDRSIDVNTYCRELLKLFTKRVEPHGETTDRILQIAYGDADDYDDVNRLPYTIDEGELRLRVARSLAELNARR
jgi:hypothetical protein